MIGNIWQDICFNTDFSLYTHKYWRIYNKISEIKKGPLPEGLDTLFIAGENKISEIKKGILPDKLRILHIDGYHHTISEIKEGVLPQGLKNLHIKGIIYKMHL